MFLIKKKTNGVLQNLVNQQNNNNIDEKDFRNW